MAGIAALAVTVFAAGCGGKASPAHNAASASPTADPAAKAALLASTTQLAQQSYHVTAGSRGMTGSGDIDPATRSGSLAVTGTRPDASATITEIKVGSDIYLKADGGTLASAPGIAPGKWMHLDASALNDSASIMTSIMSMPGSDGGGVDGILAGVVSAQRGDGKNFTGTLDPLKTSQSSLSMAALGTIAVGMANGGIRETLPFKATLDDQGRIASLNIDGGPLLSGATIDLTFTDYGKPVTVSKPAASTVVEAPTSVIQMVKGQK
jgi:hypothetical protein